MLLPEGEAGRALEVGKRLLFRDYFDRGHSELRCWLAVDAEVVEIDAPFGATPSGSHIIR